MFCRVAAIVLLLLGSIAAPAHAQQRSVLIGSTHTTQDSGLLNAIELQFTAATGIEARFLIYGTGQVLDTARRGDVDVVLSHIRSEEERFVADGYGVRRLPVMYNDFVLVGPKSDPARVAGSTGIVSALVQVKQSRSTFISRGDRSGTHAAELSLWRSANIGPQELRASWYREIGQGMGAALGMASSLGAYVLTDRGTWLNFRHRGDLAILVEGDRPLLNQYGVMLVNPARHPHVKTAEGQAFIDWLTGPQGQAAIAAYRINGEQVFFPNAHDPKS
jgi:tungstate transport system substrate-binding protein